MEFIFICLAAGGLIGFLRPPSPGVAKLVNYATMAGSFVLLVSMGAQLGANESVLADLGRMGIQAFILSATSILGSILLVRLISGKIERRLSAPVGEDSHRAGEDN